MSTSTTILARFATVLVAAGLTAGAAAQEGSDERDGSVRIKKLPFMGEGNTTGKTDDSDAVCPFEDSTAPDVYYRITPLTDITVRITLCDSGYDTKVYVLDPQDNVVDCNDDFCVEGEEMTLRSEIECVSLNAGIDYDICVDGFGQESGAYTIEVMECEPPPPFACPSEARPEGETCAENTEDDFNGGCNAEPPVFTDVECDDVICGEIWYDVDTGDRDTDWYQIVTTETTTLNLRGAFNFDTGLLGFIQMREGEEGSGDCAEVLGLSPFVSGEDGEIVTISSPELPPGTHWIFVAPQFGQFTIPCAADNDYWFELTCGDDDPCPADTNGDGMIDFDDLLRVLDGWGPCPG